MNLFRRRIAGYLSDFNQQCEATDLLGKKRKLLVACRTAQARSAIPAATCRIVAIAALTDFPEGFSTPSREMIQENFDEADPGA